MIKSSASFVDPFCYLGFVFVYQTVLSDPCEFVVTCIERDDHWALLYLKVSCVFVNFQYNDLGQLW